MIMINGIPDSSFKNAFCIQGDKVKINTVKDYDNRNKNFVFIHVCKLHFILVLSIWLASHILVAVVLIL